MPRPRSDTFYVKISPNISSCLSIDTKAAISCPRTIASLPSPPTPHPASTADAPSASVLETDPFCYEANTSCRDSTGNLVSSLSYAPVSPSLRFPWALKTRPECPPKCCFITPILARKAFANPHASLNPSSLRHQLVGETRTALDSVMADIVYASTSSERFAFPKARQPSPPLLKRSLNRCFDATEHGKQARRFGSVRGAWEVERDLERARRGGYLFPSATRSSSLPLDNLWEQMDAEMTVVQPRSRRAPTSSNAVLFDAGSAMCKRVCRPAVFLSEEVFEEEDGMDTFFSSGFYEDSDSEEEEEENSSEETLSDEELEEVLGREEDVHDAIIIDEDDVQAMINGWEFVSSS